MDEDELASSPSVQLPMIAIQSILSSLPPGDAIRASAASRLWRSAWMSSPTLDFDEKPCPLKGSDFFDYVDGSIALWRDRCDGRINLQRLSVSAAVDSDELAARLHAVVAFDAVRNVKSVELANQAESFWMVPSSSALLTLLFDCKSLDSLSLTCFQFFALNPLPIKSFSVKKLSFSIVLFDDATLRNLISCFPSLEDLDLGFCMGLDQIRIPSPSLKKFSIFLCEDEPEAVLIDAPSLRSFSYSRSIRPPGVIEFSSCKSLTSLTFNGVVFDPKSANNQVGDFISQIPLLEDLTFKSCKFGGRVEVSHSHLKSLNLKTSYAIKRAVIDTPNLRLFKYFGGVFHFESFKCRYGFLEADLGLCTCSFDDTEWFWFVKLRNFLENFSKCCSIVLHCYVEGFPVELRDNDFLPDPFDTSIMHLTLTNRELALEDCIPFVGAMVELFPCVETLCVKTPFAIISIKYDESGSFTMNWCPTVGASDTEKYGVGYEFIRDVMKELAEFLSWSGDDMEEDVNKDKDDMTEDDENKDKDEDKDKDDMGEDRGEDKDKDEDTPN